MQLRLNVDKLKATIPRCDVFQTVGRLHSIRETISTDLAASIGDVCEIQTQQGRTLKAEVIAVDRYETKVITYETPMGLAPGLRVLNTGKPLQIPVGDALLGRVINGLGQLMDNAPVPHFIRWRESLQETPGPLDRTPISKPLVTGQRAVDGLLTIGMGQRIGLFAGSGVGKSTLLGEIATHSNAEINVIALVGERGREVLPFLKESLGSEGLKKSIVVVATSDETPLMKVQAVRTALTIAEDYRTQGANVLFFFDSLTRFANAQKEIGLARGEAPGLRGYPSSVFSTMAAVLERMGTDAHGSITGIVTILVDGDDFNEPVSDAARSILDGHILLDRKLAAKGHYPAIDIPRSLSRLFREVTTQQQQNAAQKIRQSLGIYEEVAELIRVGLYQPGYAPEVDSAVQRLPPINQFLQQGLGEVSSFRETVESLSRL